MLLVPTRSRSACQSVLPSGVFDLFGGGPLSDHLFSQSPAGFFPIRPINVADDRYCTLVLIRCTVGV
jgi:hypothetical protein